MSKINLSSLTLQKLEKKEMGMIKGQGCTAKCSGGSNDSINQVMADVRNHITISDSIKTKQDTIR